MSRASSCCGPVLCATLLVASADGPGLLAQQVGRVGTELQVNTFTTSFQSAPVVAMSGEQDFVIAWSSVQDGSGYGVFGRRFADGVAQGTEFQVNLYTSDQQDGTAVGIAEDGRFVVVWNSRYQDGGEFGVFARRFDAAGLAQGLELQVNSSTAADQSAPAIAMDALGRFVIAWQSTQNGATDVFALRFDSSGVAQATEFIVNSFVAGGQRLPAVAISDSGAFIVVWDSFTQDGSGYGVFGQRFSPTGARQGPEFQVNAFFTGNQYAASVATDANGDFVVAWESDLQDGSGKGIFARRFDSSGTPQGEEITVNEREIDDQRSAQVALDEDGDFVVVWTSELQDGSGYGVFARRFRDDGALRTAELLANRFTSGSQRTPSVAADDDGDFLVAWQSEGQDGSQTGVFAQRFGVAALIDVDGNGAYLPLSDGVLLLRFAFGFSGDTLVEGAVGLGCTRCDAPSITAYLQSML